VLVLWENRATKEERAGGNGGDQKRPDVWGTRESGKRGQVFIGTAGLKRVVGTVVGKGSIGREARTLRMGEKCKTAFHRRLPRKEEQENKQGKAWRGKTCRRSRSGSVRRKVKGAPVEGSGRLKRKRGRKSGNEEREG